MIPPPTKVSKPVRRVLGKTSSISITGELQPKKKKTDEEDRELSAEEMRNLPKESFSLDQFTSVWNTYAKVILKEGKDSLYSTLTKHKPDLQEGNKIVLPIDNRVQESILSTERSKLLEYIRKTLNNYSIMLETEITTKQEDAHLYTPKEKFKEMVKKNPDLMKFKQRLNLDIQM